MASSAVSGWPYWDDRDWQEAWDELILGEDTWPGVWEISGPGVSRKIDVKKTKGEDGATIKDEGYQPARITLTGIIWTEEQWDLLQRLIAKVHPRKPGGLRTPLEIYHPQSSLLGITQIYIDKIGIPKKPTAGDGKLSISMSALEWVPQPKPVRTGTGGAAGACGGSDCANCRETDRAIANLQGMLTIALQAGDSAAAATLGDAINAEAAKKSGCSCHQACSAASPADQQAATLEDLQNELAKALLNGDAEAADFYANLINQMDYS